MRYSLLGGLLMSAWIGAWPLAAHADYLSSARAAMQKGDLKAAQIDLRNAVRSDPQNGEAHYLLGRVSFELGDPVAAEREAADARRRGYNPQLSVPLLARSLLAQSKFSQLLDQLTTNGEDANLDAAILVFRGYAQIGMKLPEDAQKSFEQAAKTAPNSVEPLLAQARLAEARGDTDAAQKDVDRALSVQPKSPEALIAKSQLLRMKGDGPGALEVLDGLLKDQPTSMQARLDRASLEIALNKTDVAKQDIAAVLKATPGNVQGIYLQAVLEAQAKDFKAANADLERIAAYVPRIPRGYFLLAVVKEQLGQIAQAEDAAARYLSRAPNDLAGYKLLARLQFSQRHPDKVIETLSKVVDTGKADAETYDLLGRAYAATNRGTDAVQAFQKAQALAPNDVGLQTRLATVRMGLGEADAAMGDLEHTLQIAPKLPAVGEALFFAALATGDLNKAKDALEKVKAAEGDTPVVANLEGLLKLAELNLPGAHDVFAALVQKSPDFLPAQINLARVMAMQGQTQDAEKLLGDILAKHAAAEPALTMLASNYAQTNRVPQAITLVEKAHAAEPTNLRLTASLGDLYIRSGSPQKALDLANLEKGPAATSIPVLSLKSAAYLAQGQKDKAIEADTDILKADPLQIGVRRQLVGLLMDIGETEQARNLVKAGMAAAPRNYQLYQDYAMIGLKTGGLDSALAAADQLQSQDHDFVPARALRGDIYLAANRPDDAVEAYKNAFSAAPSTMLVTRLAGAQIRGGHADDAIATLGGWIEKHPEDLVAIEQVAEIRIAKKDLSGAAQDLTAILAKKPHDPVALNNLAWVYQQQKDPRATELARQAYVLSPGAQTADTLGWILTTSGKADTGLALLRQASAEGKGDPRILYHYAVALKDTGNKTEAVKLLNAVVGVKGEFTEKTEAQELLTELNKGT